MRPRRSSRGERLPRAQPSVPRGSFNAATAFKPWRTTAPSPGPGTPLPLQCRHGVQAVDNGRQPDGAGAGAALQCGHGVQAVENAGGRRHHHGVQAVENKDIEAKLAEVNERFNAATAFKPWRTFTSHLTKT